MEPGLTTSLLGDSAYSTNAGVKHEKRFKSCALFLGFGVYLPFWLFINTPDYMTLDYSTYTVVWFAFIFNAAGVLLQWIEVSFGSKRSARSRLKIQWVILLFFLLLIAVIGVLREQRKMSQQAGTIVLFVCFFMTGAASCTMLGTLNGVVGTLGPKVNSLFQLGGVSSGLFMAVVRPCIKLLVPSDAQGIRESALWTYVLSMVLLFVTMYVCFFLLSTPGLKVNNYGGSMSLRDAWRDTKPARGSFFVLFATFCLTTSMFPGVSSLLTSESLHISEASGWFPVILASLFSAGDFLGKLIPVYWICFKRDGNGLKYSVILHAAVCILLLFSTNHTAFPDVHSDAFTFCILIAIGILNGYITSVAYIFAPQKVDEFSQEMVGNLGVMFMLIGLVIGSVVGVVLAYCVAAPSGAEVL